LLNASLCIDIVLRLLQSLTTQSSAVATITEAASRPAYLERSEGLKTNVPVPVVFVFPKTNATVSVGILLSFRASSLLDISCVVLLLKSY